MKGVRTLFILMTTMLLTAFAANDIRHDMVKFDKIYIAALALTSQGKNEESRKAVDALQKEWGVFKDRHYNAHPRDTQWKKDFDHMNGMVNDAVRIVASGQNVTDAHEALEHVREIFMQLRQRHRIEYFIDGLTGFHVPMEAIVLAAKDKTASTLTDADLALITKTLPQAEQAWQRVTAAKLDAADYLLTQAQADDARKLIALENTALAALKQALVSGDKARITQAAVALKPNFAKLFMIFGDFKPYGA